MSEASPDLDVNKIADICAGAVQMPGSEGHELLRGELATTLAKALQELMAANVAQAFVRGVEWRDENSGYVDLSYRYKAACDYADATLSKALSSQPQKGE